MLVEICMEAKFFRTNIKLQDSSAESSYTFDPLILKATNYKVLHNLQQTF